ncbi:peptidoglycan DD-metalloendopeptidase family protein [Myxococcota bacterium]|nr:peptidoglycan DD-metalloendopeptidase family protein [Myxococcota bacterium]
MTARPPWHRLLLLAGLLVVALGAAGLVAWRVVSRAAAPPALPPVASTELVLPPPTPPAVTLRHRIGPGDTLGQVLSGYGIDAHALREAALAHHDLARLREGRDLMLVYPPDAGEVAELRYELSEDEQLVAVREGAGWQAHVEQAVYQARMVRRDFTVQATLWDAAVDAGLRPADILALAHIFESDVDFNTEVQQGARVELVVEEKTRADGFQKLGAPLAARFHNAGKEWVATRWQPPGAREPDYYDDEGFNRRGAFLRSPLEFSRVTSGFSKGRFHPILKTKRAHLGTDFGAPTGTPVRSVARGTVLKAGRNGGHGNYVEVQHEGPYRTSYSHLSRILVRKGEVVGQGQVVGQVGSTGLSTGPHLHFQLWVNGRHADAMTADLPRNERLGEDALPAFHAWRAQVRQVLDGLAPPASLEGQAPESPG